MRILQQQPPPGDGRTVAAGVVRRESLERVGDDLAEERLGRVVTNRARRAVRLRHEVELLDDGHVRAFLPEIGQLDEPVVSELALDANAEPPVFGVGPIGRDDARRRRGPEAGPEVGAQPEARAIRLQELAARHRIGEIRLKRQPVVARHGDRCLTRESQLVHGIPQARHRVDLEG